MEQSKENILKKYNENIRKRTEDIALLEGRKSNLMIYEFCGIVFGIYMFISFFNKPLSLTAVIAVVIPIIFLFWVLKRKQRITDEVYRNKSFILTLENELNIGTGKENTYSNGERFVDHSHLYASDLDIFGKGSLFSLLNRCSTNIGMNQLFTTLTSFNSKDLILSRQEAIKEITNNIEKTFEFRARIIRYEADHFERTQNTLGGELKDKLIFTKNKLLSNYTILIPYLGVFFLFIAIKFSGWAWMPIVIILLINLGVYFIYVRKVEVLFKGFDLMKSTLLDYSFCLQWINDGNWKSNYLKGFKNTSYDNTALVNSLNELERVLKLLDVRGFLMNILLLLDIKCALKLSHWYKNSSSIFLEGLEKIGRFEELISFSTLNFNNPQWVFPIIMDEPGFSTSQIGHPLINVRQRVYNDYEFLERPTVDIITGSNMAGKSTFLRTVGINLILAYAGTKVCASSLKVSHYNIVTYMRIKDSINDNVSTFRAELNRIKLILNELVLEKNHLLIVDEMLRGTNSYDKYIGSKAFLKKVLLYKSAVLFATHDLQLSKMDYNNNVRNFHFDMVLDGADMIFDYKIKSGPCKTFNASFLLKEIGLDLEFSDTITNDNI